MVFDGTLYRHKPELGSYGIKPVDILYMTRFWPNDRSPSALGRLPRESVVRQLAREASAKAQPVVIDIEHWRLDGGDKQMNTNLARYESVLRWMRNEAPGLKLGYFGHLPMTAYGWSIRGQGSRAYRRWQIENKKRGALAPLVDAIYPPLYTYFPNQRDWVRFAIANLREAHRYGKPVYAFLWPQYVERNNQVGLQYLPAKFWRLQLETVRKYADGVVIWGGWDGKHGGPATWDETAPWWTVTKQFLRELQHGQETDLH